jgi:hypothetical protein
MKVFIADTNFKIAFKSESHIPVLLLPLQSMRKAPFTNITELLRRWFPCYHYCLQIICFLHKPTTLLPSNFQIVLSFTKQIQSSCNQPLATSQTSEGCLLPAPLHSRPCHTVSAQDTHTPWWRSWHRLFPCLEHIPCRYFPGFLRTFSGTFLSEASSNYPV